MVGFKPVGIFLADQTQPVNEFGDAAVFVFDHQQLAERGVGIVRVGLLGSPFGVCDAVVFHIIGIGIPARTEQPVAGIVG